MRFGVAVACIYGSPDRRSRYTCTLVRKRDRGRDGGEEVRVDQRIAGLARWDSPVTARGQLARTGRGDERTRTRGGG